MCGITGFINFNAPSSHEELKQMTQSLHHRGPDDEGFELFNLPDIQIGLGHKRLSIIDISMRGHQPMSNMSKDCYIVYNGEIYNHFKIRQELEVSGFQFLSSSDTEVVLNAYVNWGIGSIERFIGMFAFTIFDQKKNKIFIVRDRAGVKPLYYYWDNSTLLFGSELKVFFHNNHFKKHLDLNSLSLFFKYGYIPAPHCIYKQCHKLQPGHYLEIDLNKKTMHEKKYWDVIKFYNKPKFNISEADALNVLDTLLTNAFEYRMVSDVPVGVFLSGGYDSSIVTAILQAQRSKKMKTFTIGFEEKEYNEAIYAKQIAKYIGTDHEELICKQKDALEIIPELSNIYDEPFADTSAIPTILVSRMARKKVKVCLSADGGDESFAGYNKYDGSLRYYKLNKILAYPNVIIHLLDNMPIKDMPGIKNIPNIKQRLEMIKLVLEKNPSPVKIMDLISQNFRQAEIDQLFFKPFQSYSTGFHSDYLLYHKKDHINNMLAIDYITYLPEDILTKVDRASMSVSLEAREPLLDHRIIEFAAQLPSHLKYNRTKKYLLKKLCYKYLPKSLLDRPKKGFSPPIGSWLQNQLSDYISYYLDKDRIQRENIFDYNEIKRILGTLSEGSYRTSQKIWSLLIFEMWYEKYC